MEGGGGRGGGESVGVVAFALAPLHCGGGVYGERVLCEGRAIRGKREGGRGAEGGERARERERESGEPVLA